MRTALAIALSLLVPAAATAAPARGELLSFVLDDSAQFPGTRHAYEVYVPAAYQPDRPAALFVGLDQTSSEEAAAALDELIARKQMPVTVGVFVGVADDQRSLELDSPGDSFARFLVEELLPDVQKRQTSDGRPLRLSAAAGDRTIGGTGSGAVAAFTAAWEKPTEFARVWSEDGAFVAIRGADRYPALVRRFEPRPLRLFLTAKPGHGEDSFGDRWLGTQALHRALRWAGYDVPAELRPAVGASGRARFSQAMRWLWRGWPQQPVAPRPGKNPVLSEILISAADWELVGEGYRFTEGPTVNPKGEVFFNDIPAARTYKVGLDGQVSVFLSDSRKANGQAFGPDGRLYAMTGGAGQVMAYDPQGRGSVITEGFSGNDLVVAHNGNIYLTSPPDAREPARASHVYLVRPDGQKLQVDTGLKYANGIALSPDQRTLYVDDHRSRWVFRYQIQPDGTLKHKQRFCALVVPETADDTSADGIKVDRLGRLYVATRTGLLQICDGEGRVVAILPTPNRRISNLTFGGPDFDVLYATAGDRVFRRKLKVQGANAWAAPLPPP
jgi:gluconolactonase